VTIQHVRQAERLMREFPDVTVWWWYGRWMAAVSGVPVEAEMYDTAHELEVALRRRHLDRT
jgi:hypothetical protein